MSGLEDGSLPFKTATKMIVETGDVSGLHMSLSLTVSLRLSKTLTVGLRQTISQSVRVVNTHTQSQGPISLYCRLCTE